MTAVLDSAVGARRLPMPTGDDVFAVGKRVYARALRPSDLPHLAAWAADPLLEEMVGSELFTLSLALEVPSIPVSFAHPSTVSAPTVASDLIS